MGNYDDDAAWVIEAQPSVQGAASAGAVLDASSVSASPAALRLGAGLPGELPGRLQDGMGMLAPYRERATAEGREALRRMLPLLADEERDARALATLDAHDRTKIAPKLSAVREMAKTMTQLFYLRDAVRGRGTGRLEG